MISDEQLNALVFIGLTILALFAWASGWWQGYKARDEFDHQHEEK